MAESNIPVTGGNIHTYDRTISGTLVEDQVVLPGEYPYASYSVLAAAISIGTANDHVIQLMAGSTNYVRIRHIKYEQSGNATTAQIASVQVLRLTSAGSGGSAVTPRRFDLGDAAANATGQTLPSSKGTESDVLFQWAHVYRQAVAATSAQIDDVWEWTQHRSQKPIIIANSAAAGIAIKTLSAVAGATVNVTIEFVETDWRGAS
jgi:hypothetical protein